MAVEVVLIIVTATSSKKFKAPEDMESIRETFRMNTLLPLMSESIRHNSSQSEKHRIYIEFNREFQIRMVAHNPECSFKLAVYIGDESHILTKK